MAKKEKVQFNYAAEVKKLKEQGPERLYYLCGPEDYLRECYLTELRQLCVATEDEFAYRRLDGPGIDLGELAEAVDDQIKGILIHSRQKFSGGLVRFNFFSRGGIGKGGFLLALNDTAFTQKSFVSAGK